MTYAKNRFVQIPNTQTSHMRGFVSHIHSKGFALNTAADASSVTFVRIF